MESTRSCSEFQGVCYILLAPSTAQCSTFRFALVYDMFNHSTASLVIPVRRFQQEHCTGTTQVLHERRWKGFTDSSIMRISRLIAISATRLCIHVTLHEPSISVSSAHSKQTKICRTLRYTFAGLSGSGAEKTEELWRIRRVCFNTKNVILWGRHGVEYTRNLLWLDCSLACISWMSNLLVRSDSPEDGFWAHKDNISCIVNG